MRGNATRFRRSVAVGLVVLGLALAGTQAHAGGLWLYEVGSPDLGTAGAGRAALAADASTAWGNPAGMTRLSSSEILVGLQPIIATAEFDPGSRSTVPGSDGGNAGGVIPSGGLYGVWSVLPEFKLGASINSYIGGNLDYENDWVGRYYTTKAEILTFNFNPVFAWRVLPWMSFGGGVSVQWAQLKSQAAVNNILDRFPDGRLKYEDSNVGFGGNFGFLFEIDERNRIGVTYRSGVDQSFDDVPSFAQLGPLVRAGLQVSGVLGSNLHLSTSVPQEVMLSGFSQVTDDLSLMANFGWQNWSHFGQYSVSLASSPPRDIGVNSGFDDTLHGAIGGQYRVADPVTLQLGFAYDSSAVGEASRGPALPVDRQLRFATGVLWDIDEHYRLGLAYEYVSLGSAPIDTTRGPLAGTLQGDYGPNALSVVGLTLAYRF
jgi:long-chain fatty acid transport protein